MQMQLPKETKVLLNIIERHGGISKEQARYILSNGCGKSEYAVEAIMEGMYIKRLVSVVNDEFIVPYAKKDFNRENVILIWVAINEIINNELDKADQEGLEYDYQKIMDNLNTLSEGRDGYDMTFFANSNIFDLTFVQSTDLHKAIFVDRTAKQYAITKGGKEEYQASELFVFESTDKDDIILKALKEKGLSVPYDVYFVEFPETLAGVPNIRMERISAMRND